MSSNQRLISRLRTRFAGEQLVAERVPADSLLDIKTSSMTMHIRTFAFQRPKGIARESHHIRSERSHFRDSHVSPAATQQVFSKTTPLARHARTTSAENPIGSIPEIRTTSSLRMWSPKSSVLPLPDDFGLSSIVNDAHSVAVGAIVAMLVRKARVFRLI